MSGRFRHRPFAAAAASALLLLTAIPSHSSPGSAVRSPADTTKPLHPLMVGLAQDMDRIATGLWYEDYDLIQQGAQGIAQHPKIPPAQIAKIKKALDNQFETFVLYDKRVHSLASKLVEAAEACNWSGVLNTHEQLQRGCMSCHTAFRDRVRPILQP